MSQHEQTIEGEAAQSEPIRAEAVDETEASEPLEIPPRRILLPSLLFAATCFSTFLCGLTHWFPAAWDPILAAGDTLALRQQILTNGLDALVYMLAVIGILLAHEMGHFLMTLRYGVRSSFPFFIPMPLFLFGTMGAVIAMDGRKANRKEIFDIGIAGPLAGLVIAVPVVIAGVAMADFNTVRGGGFRFDIPIFIEWLLRWLQPAGYAGQNEIWLTQMNPLLMAGWFGLLITGLNMAPVSQLDGGHVIYTLFGEQGKWIARGFVLAAIAFITLTGTYIWAVMLLLVILVLGVDHPPTADDTVEIGPVRTVLGWASLAIPVLCLPAEGLVAVG